jgi:hypothetical protein
MYFRRYPVFSWRSVHCLRIEMNSLLPRHWHLRHTACRANMGIAFGMFPLQLPPHMSCRRSKRCCWCKPIHKKFFCIYKLIFTMAATLQEEFLFPRDDRASWVLRDCSEEHIFGGYNWIIATHTHARKTLGYSRWRHIHDDKQKTKCYNGPAELTFLPLKYGCFPRQRNTFKELQKANCNSKKESPKILTFFSNYFKLAYISRNIPLAYMNSDISKIRSQNWLFGISITI